ncbi:uncharacterized protein PODANS_7_4690 [Podospora anserina S mat+]|uniref:Podospora anserina S mat+ genomic DNA chromosome 7, supercontig 1 n=1 Tax=Podospora anserina (strain S / ATCC MYA-4624 / DSM 980 / FGSC 10383) TaxID=515849 RepID=B2AUY5_PODAN|nr:uncharacterized protein PODANS_7_4690 [Podospora anserina S mat+]CAP68208.1 unnamed protein product [Podospora anserina S mat+]CDP31679.1 Putative protein of unknown function [Podospora anserina S mat+]
MSQPWKSESVALREISRFNEGVQCRTRGAIWANAEKGEFWIWGGYLPKIADGMNDTFIWKFTADGWGGGSWAKETPLNFEKLPSLQQTKDSAFMVAHDKGYVLGGVGSWLPSDEDAGPGMVTYDFRSKVVDNGTGPAIGILGKPATLTGANLLFMPGYNMPNGLGLVLGGHALATFDGTAKVEESHPLDLHNLTFFDPVTNEQYWQLTTGHIPPSPRSRACVAGPFRTPGGNYDLFLFGGENKPTYTRYDDAYVLSLPGFVWTKVPSPAPGGSRAYHSCLSVGRNQVLSVGGTRGGGFDNDWRSPDPVPQGLLLFNMTSLRWQLEYFVEGDLVSGYERASTIRNWYQNGSLDRVQWSSEKVQRMFGGSGAVKSTVPDVSDSDASPSNTTINVATATVTSEPNPSTIPLATVVGGICGAFALAFVVSVLGWFIYRSRQKRAPVKETDKWPRSQDKCIETGPDGYYVYGIPGELQGTTVRDSSMNWPAQELDSGHQYPELSDGRS